MSSVASNSTPPSSSYSSDSSQESPPQIPDENPPSQIIMSSVDEHKYFAVQHIIGNARGVPVYQAISGQFGFPEHDVLVAMKEIVQEPASVTLINNTRLVNSRNAVLVSVKEEVYHQERLRLVFEFAGPSLRSLYPQGAELSTISSILSNVVSCLVSIHRCDMVHRELNAGHIYGAENFFKVGFGATVYDYGQAPQTPPGFLPVGDICLWASAPEVYYENNGDMSSHTTASDIWQVGITAFELAWGSNIRVKDRDDLELQIELATNGLGARPNSLFLNGNFKKFLSDCLSDDPTDRPTSQQLVNHVFLRRY